MSRVFPEAVGQVRGAAGKASSVGWSVRSATDAAAMTAFGGDHLVVDLVEERADEADHGGFVGEDADDVDETRFLRSRSCGDVK